MEAVEGDEKGTSPVPPPIESIEVDEPVASPLTEPPKIESEVKDDPDVEAANAEANEAGAEEDNEAAGDADEDENDASDSIEDGKVSNALYKEFKAVTETLLDFKIKSKNNEEHFPSNLFKRLPNKRILPDYYEVIKEPSAISTLRGKIQRKQYTGVPEFVRDFALVVHNAQLYNRPNSQPVRDVLQLDAVFKTELQRLKSEGFASEEDIVYPDLGEIPYASPEPDPVTESEDDDDEEDEDDEADDSDDDKRRRRGRKGARTKKGEDEDEDDKAAEAEAKRRGRPPKVATPIEHRIDRILKSLRKAKSSDGAPMLFPFERLPDKAELPDYYAVIKEPIAYDILRKKAKRKKYQSVDDLMKDIKLMFDNAMLFNEDGSEIYNWAQELLSEAYRVSAEEKAKPDSEYASQSDGRSSLPYITYKGEQWKIGDWIHIQNPNDVTKPIVAQIYRTWKTANDEEWINACWYYRPEQTVHQYEKHFYPNEVVKTGQYRDHKIDEVLNKCFVMFYTRYSRGRPRALPAGTEIYVCEARYNEEKHKFNKIKTWASCLPDEVRDKDYDMDLFQAPQKFKKVPSPLLSRLKADAKSTDDLPQPEWNHANAPPLVGGIHKRAREDNQSPPPEPTPPPQPAPASFVRTPSLPQANNMQSFQQNQNTNANGTMQNARPTVPPAPQRSFTNSNANTFGRQTSYSATPQPHASQTQTPQPQTNQRPYQYNPQPTQPAPLAAAHPGQYSATTPSTTTNRPVSGNAQPVAYNAQQNTAPQNRIAEAYVLSNTANASIPANIRDQFPQDEQGRVLFFTSPPLDRTHVVTDRSGSDPSQPLEHSSDYVQAVAKRKRNQMMKDAQAGSDAMIHDSEDNQRRSHDERAQLVGRSVNVLNEHMKQATSNEYMSQYGDDWRGMLMADLEWADERRKRAKRDDVKAEQRRRAFANAHVGMTGNSATNVQGYITGWQQNFFTGRYLDDYDSRLP